MTISDRPTPEQNYQIDTLVRAINALFSLAKTEKGIAITALGEVMIYSFTTMLDKVSPEEAKTLLSGFMRLIEKQGLETIDVYVKKASTKNEFTEKVNPVVAAFNKGKLS